MARQRDSRIGIYSLQAVNSVRGGVVGPLMPFFLYELSRRSFYLTSISTNVGAVITLLLSPVMGVVVDRVGRRKPLIAASTLVGMLTSYAASYVESYEDYILITAGGSVVGLAGGLAFSSLLADLTSNGERGRTLGLYSTIGTLGNFLGNALSSIVYQCYGVRGAIRVVALTGVVPLAIVLLMIEEPVKGAGGRGGAFSLLETFRNRDFLRLFLVQALIRTPHALVGPLYAIYFTEELGGSVESWSMLAAVTTLAGVTSLPYGYLVDRFGPARVMAACSLAWTAMFWGYALSRDPLTFSLFFVIPVGNAFSIAFTSMLYEVCDEGRRGVTLGSFDSLASLHSTLVNIAGGLLADYYGPRAVFTVAAAYLLLVAPAYTLLGRRRR